MAKLFEWNEKELGLKVKAMDDEHIQLIHLMNDLHESFQKNEPMAMQKQKLEQLGTYTVKHFTDEEAYMEKMNYDGIGSHKILHQQLLTRFKGHVESFKANGKLAPDFFDFLKVWLVAHIRGIDMKYADFSRKSPKAG